VPPHSTQRTLRPVGEPGILEDLARRAGLTPMRAGDGAPAERTRRVVEAIVRDVAEPYRRADGSYRFENRFRYLIAAN
jgi:hypothetical protein